jgi:phosphoribosylglycinamide formyltransferase-1
MINIAIFASGSGTNAERLFEHFAQHPRGRVAVVLTNNPRAGVIARAERFGIPVVIFTKQELVSADTVLSHLAQHSVDLIVLAGFLLMIPPKLIQAYHDRIVNIHPALLPAYGGAGMYGRHVHEAVVAARETETGISIHYVNEHYDEGQIIRQERCTILPSDRPEDVADRVLRLEHQHYPEVVAEIVDRLASDQSL